MVIERKLTKEEFNKLVDEADDSETRNLKRILGDGAYDYFENEAIEYFGIVIDGTPVYWGALSKDRSIWTIVSKCVRQQYSLYKHSKRKVLELVKKYGKLSATMETENITNIRWCMKIGFKPIDIDNGLITLEYRG